MKKVDIELSLCRAQTYDGAGNMAGRIKGCSAHFLKIVPEATYYHCVSHQLNLAISKTAKVNEIQVMLSTLTSVGLFFKYSPKRQRKFEQSIDTYNESLVSGGRAITKTKLKTMCQTRWIERHTSMQDFDSMYPPLLTCFDEIANNTEGIWDGKTITEAQGLLHSISTPAFIAAFKVNLHMFGYTKPLSCLLQGSTIDVISAYQEIYTVKTILKGIRADPTKEFQSIFRSALVMAKVAGSASEMPVPRTCGRQTARSNVEASTPEEYWRRTVFVPFLDHIMPELSDRFCQLNEDADCCPAIYRDCQLKMYKLFVNDLEQTFHHQNFLVRSLKGGKPYGTRKQQNPHSH